MLDVWFLQLEDASFSRRRQELRQTHQVLLQQPQNVSDEQWEAYHVKDEGLEDVHCGEFEDILVRVPWSSRLPSAAEL